MKALPPRTEHELIERAYAIAGRSLAEVARIAHVPIPQDPKRAKGWAGQLLERVLGATSAGRAEVDFPGLGIEMKSVPVDEHGAPLESTYVCVAPLDAGMLGSWETSWVREKLSRVLFWIPLVERDAGIDKLIGAPVLWTPSEEELRALQTDWEEFADIVAHGELWRIDARLGRVLQVRPKAADREERTWAQDEEGWVRATPRGFYLRPAFTGALLARALYA